MKKLICVVAALALMLSALAGCANRYDKAPSEYTKIRWITPDYSFSIYPSKECTGSYKFGETTYSIKAEFETSTVIVRDAGNKYTRLFIADWMYKDDDLYIYNIDYNTKAYKEFETNYSEFYTLSQEKL